MTPKATSTPATKKINRDDRVGPIHLATMVRGHLKEVYFLEDERINTIMHDARRSLDTTIMEAEAALGRGDMATLTDRAHKMKGTLLQLGMHDFAEMARRVEQQQVRCGENMILGLEAQLGFLRQNVLDLC